MGNLYEFNGGMPIPLGGFDASPEIIEAASRPSEQPPLNPGYRPPRGRTPTEIIAQTMTERAIIKPPIPPRTQGEQR